MGEFVLTLHILLCNNRSYYTATENRVSEVRLGPARIAKSEVPDLFTMPKTRSVVGNCKLSGIAAPSQHSPVMDFI